MRYRTLLKALLFATILAVELEAQTLTVLHSFQGPPDGAQPIGSLIRDAAGNLYGTTLVGGLEVARICPPIVALTPGCGTVFKIDTSGKETVIHSFLGGKDGSHPNAALVADSAGNLYGTTLFGGDYGEGVVFEVTLNGSESVLYSFAGSTDGGQPFGPLLRDDMGNLYGTTSTGGAFDQGTVFKVTPGGQEIVLHSFHLQTDGNDPRGGLVRDSAGNFYGYTATGGSKKVGTVFKLDSNGAEGGLFNFLGGGKGMLPSFGTLIGDGSGNLYGTTVAGGDRGCDCGLVYELDASGNETVLHTFTNSDGSNPQSGLVRDAAGNLYGTTSDGGHKRGIIFKIDQGGSETVLHYFEQEDGGQPQASLIMDADGNLYGTTQLGGSYGQGVVFKLTP